MNFFYRAIKIITYSPLLVGAPAVALEDQNAIATESETDKAKLFSFQIKHLEFSASYGLEYYISHNRFLKSEGYTVGLHAPINDSVNINLTATAIPFSGKTYRLGSAIEYFFRIGYWQPSLAAEARLFFGDSIAYSRDQDALPNSTYVSFSPSLKVAALQFANSEGSRVSLVTPNAGPVFFDGKIGLQTTLSLIEVLSPL